MKYILVEDEKIASERLRREIANIRPEYKHMVTIFSIESGLISLQALKPDLIFMDIQLADGLSFDLFEVINPKCPVIFTTAYNQYALQAFKHNSVDYLLKPIDPQELEAAIIKFENNRVPEVSSELMGSLSREISGPIKEQFIVRIGDHLHIVKTADLSMVYSSDKQTYLVGMDGRKYPVDYSLERVEEMIDSREFYRISRKYLVAQKSIHDIIAYTNSRLELRVQNFKDEPVIVAREKVQDFKTWLDR